jgi:hypothetical protein
MDKTQKIISFSDRILDMWLGFCIGWLWFGNPDLPTGLFITAAVYLLIVAATLIISYFTRNKL